MIVGIKPTVGQISRYGIIPDYRRSGHRRTDGATVADAAMLLGVLESAAPDPNDRGDAGVVRGIPNGDYTWFI